MTLGIVDVGTNSIHLLIGILGLNGKFHVVLKERDLTRLGEGGLADGRLTHAAMNRAMSVLRRYAATLTRCRVDHIEAVATSAVREAKNGPAFIRRVRARLGLPLRMINGREEARLIYLGVVQAHQLHRSIVIITIGGGSAQVIYGNGAHLRYAVSLPLGGARLAQRFLHHDPPRLDELEALKGYTHRAWAPVARALHRHRWQMALGSSATISQLMMAAYRRIHRRSPARKQPLRMSRRALHELVQWLSTSTTTERVRLEGIDPRREDLLLPTAVALLTWMERCGVSQLRHAPGSLREGLVIDYLLRHVRRGSPKIEPPLADLLGVNGGGDFSLPGKNRWRRQLLHHLQASEHQA